MSYLYKYAKKHNKRMHAAAMLAGAGLGSAAGAASAFGRAIATKQPLKDTKEHMMAGALLGMGLGVRKSMKDQDKIRSGNY